MGKYKFSVVTPFHNVNLEFFDRAIDHMVNQTIGFENIQWIIVLHNCEKEYIDGVHSKLEKYENVVLKEVSNNYHTPSNPRNHGIKLAEADYIGFLDGDDFYRYDAIEKILERFASSKAKMVVFRREFSLEDKDMVPLSETVLWDQTVEEVVVDSKDDKARIYNDFPFFVTSRAYDRKFLIENNIWFDEDMELEEDCYFNIQVMGHADKICYAPQLIGYNYFQNSGSMLQGAKTDEEVLNCLDAVQKCIDLALGFGIYSNVIIRISAFVMSGFMMSQGLSFETREKVKDVIEPYWDMTVEIPDGRFTEPMNTLVNVMPKTCIFDLRPYKENNKNVISDGASVLRALINENKNTDYGKRYHFSDIMTKEGFQSQVPVSDYSTYEPLIDLMKSIGEKNIFTSSEIEWYLESGKGILIPATKELMEDLLHSFTGIIEGKNIFVWNDKNIIKKTFNDRIANNTAWSATIHAYETYYKYHNIEKETYLTSPQEFMTPTNDVNVDYYNILFALENEDVDQIIASFNKSVLEIFEYVEEHWEMLCDDIELGNVSIGIELKESQRRILPAYHRANPKRADELRQIFKGGFDEPVATKIWPKLKCVTAASTGRFSKCVDLLKKYIGDIPLKNGYYSTAMGVIGTSIEGTDVYELNREKIFYEFVPIEEDSQKPLFASQIKEDECYRVLVTTSVGYYRYNSGIKIKIEELKDDRILFKII